MTTKIFIASLLLFILFISFLGYAYYRLKEFDKSLDKLLEVTEELRIACNECLEVCREINQIERARCCNLTLSEIELILENIDRNLAHCFEKNFKK